MSKSKEAILAKSEGKYKALSKKELLSVYLNLPTDNRARCVPERLALIQDIFQRKGWGELPKVDIEAPVKEETDMQVWGYAKFIQLKASALKRNLQFDLTPGYIRRKLLQRKRCYYTGVPLLDTDEAFHPHKRTVDRIDCSKGYVRGNVVACSYQANQLKNLLFEGGTGHPLEIHTVEKFLTKMKATAL